MKIVADDKIPFLKGILEPYAEVIYMPGDKITRTDIIDADALIIRTRTKCNKNLLEGTKVKFIATATIGFDHIDTTYCEKNGIFWTNAAGCNSSSVMQYIASVLVNLAIKYNFCFNDKTIGIIGVGNVGKKINALAKALGINVILNDPPRERKEKTSDFSKLDYLIKNSDIITLHVPLNYEGEDKTFHLFDVEKLSELKPNTFLINSSRGEVIDNSALLKVAEKNKLKSINLDVWENEPNINLDLLKYCDIATPHIAGYSTDGKANGTSMSIQSLSRFFNLGIDNWFPEYIEKPTNTIINIDGKKKSAEKIFFEAITKTYNVMNDDKNLREKPSEFEKLRGNYPLRREFIAYSIKAINCNIEIINSLKNLGFSII